MLGKAQFMYLLFVITISQLPLTALASERPTGVSQQIVKVSALENVAGHELTAVMVELDPGISVPSHSHMGFVFVYVMEGTLRSQLNHGETKVFSVGQSWTEPPGTIHSLSQNPSSTNKVKFLAVFVAKEGAALTNFEVNQ